MSHAVVSKAALLSNENTRIKSGALSIAMIGIGVVLWAIALAIGFLNAGADDPASAKLAKYAMSSAHVGFIVALGFSLGALVFVMILHQVNAGWAASVRRPLEHMASLIVLGLLLAIPTVFLATILSGEKGLLFHWMDEYAKGDVPVAVVPQRSSGLG